MEDPKINTVIGETEESATHKDIPDEDRKKKIYSQFTPEIIECLREVIKEVQRPLEDKINILLDVQNKQLEQDSHIKDLRKEQKELKQKCEKTTHEIDTLKHRVSKLETKLLESNLIMHGVPEEAWEHESNRHEKIYNAIASTVNEADPWEKLKTARKIPIRSSRRLGKYKQGKRHPISICFERKSHADTLYNNKKNLPEGIYVDREFTPEVEEKRKILRPILRLARTKDKYKGKCKLDEDKLVIQGMKFSVNTLGNLPQDLNGYYVTSKFGEGTIAFFGQLNPFLNFHPAPFTKNGKNYPTSEHYIQEACALHFNDKTSAHRVLNTETPLQAKKIRNEIVGYNQDRWMEVAKRLVKPGITEKFHTHPNLAKVLLATENMTIAKATFDKFWGTGIPIHEQNSVDEEKWHGVGILRRNPNGNSGKTSDEKPVTYPHNKFHGGRNSHTTRGNTRTCCKKQPYWSLKLDYKKQHEKIQISKIDD